MSIIGEYRETTLPLTGELGAVTAAADDFGHAIHQVPASVAFPADEVGVADVVRYARNTGKALVPRGAGHSSYGQAQSGGGIVCDLTRLDFAAVETVAEDTAKSAATANTGAGHQTRAGHKAIVRTGAGTRWSTVLDVALARGLTPPVLTDYLELTVGGTLAVGGIGGTSHRYGAIADNVISLDVVTLDGDREVCTPDRNNGRFCTVLGSGGTGGIITYAALPLVPAPERVRVYKVAYPSVAALVDSQLAAAREGHPDYIEGQILPGADGSWDFIAELATFAHAGQSDGDPALDALAAGEDMAYRAFCGRMGSEVRLLAAAGDWYRPHPWISVFLPESAVKQYVTEALAEMTPAMVGPLPMLLYPVRRGPFPAPGLVTPSVHDELCFLFTILRTTEAGDALAEALASNERLASAAVAAGGTVYRISALPSQRRH